MENACQLCHSCVIVVVRALMGEYGLLYNIDYYRSPTGILCMFIGQ